MTDGLQKRTQWEIKAKSARLIFNFLVFQITLANVLSRHHNWTKNPDVSPKPNDRFPVRGSQGGNAVSINLCVASLWLWSYLERMQSLALFAEVFEAHLSGVNRASDSIIDEISFRRIKGLAKTQRNKNLLRKAILPCETVIHNRVPCKLMT